MDDKSGLGVGFDSEEKLLLGGEGRKGWRGAQGEEWKLGVGSILYAAYMAYL